MTARSRLFSWRQRGAAMIEFAVVGPVITLLGLASLQYGMLFFAKNQINHAGFMAARAGSMGNADLDKVREAYAKALIPIFGGGTNSAELAAAYAKAWADTAANSRIEMLNPTKESFDDWNDPELQKTLGEGRRVIPFAGQAFKNAANIGAASGQSIQDANLIKVRITYGYEPKIPLMGLIYNKYLAWLDPGDDPFRSRLIAAGRIPVVTHATLQMQSDAIEPPNPVSIPGSGNNGSPVDPGEPPISTEPPPSCGTIGCTTPPGPLDPGGPGDPPVCTGGNNG